MGWGSEKKLPGWGSNDNVNKGYNNWGSDDKKDEKTDDKVRLKNDMSWQLDITNFDFTLEFRFLDWFIWYKCLIC